MNSATIMKKLIPMIICSILGVSTSELKADREPARSLEEMQNRSSLIADGQVIRVTIEGTEETVVPNADPLIRTKYKAQFKVDKMVKGDAHEDNGDAAMLDLIYWKTPDPRYKGQPSLDLKGGDKFRLYAEIVIKAESGSLTVFLHSANEVRREAYDAESKAK